MEVVARGDAEDVYDIDDDTEVEVVARGDVITTKANNERERHIELTETEDEPETKAERGMVGAAGASRGVGNTRDAADLGIITNETGGDIKSDDDDHGTITDDYEADSEEPVTAFDRRRYSEVVGGISEMSLTDTIICVGFGYALVYATYKERNSLHDAPKIA